MIATFLSLSLSFWQGFSIAMAIMFGAATIFFLIWLVVSLDEHTRIGAALVLALVCGIVTAFCLGVAADTSHKLHLQNENLVYGGTR